MANRYHGWKFGDNETDHKVLAVFLEFQDTGEDFSAYLKSLVIADRYDERAPNEQIVAMLKEIKRLILNGAVVAQSGNVDDDQSLAELLKEMGT